MTGSTFRPVEKVVEDLNDNARRRQGALSRRGTGAEGQLGLRAVIKIGLRNDNVNGNRRNIVGRAGYKSKKYFKEIVLNDTARIREGVGCIGSDASRAVRLVPPQLLYQSRWPNKGNQLIGPISIVQQVVMITNPILFPYILNVKRLPSRGFYVQQY